MNITIQRPGVDPRQFVYSRETIALARLLQIAATGRTVGRPLQIYLAQAHGIHTNQRLNQTMKEFM